MEPVSLASNSDGGEGCALAALVGLSASGAATSWQPASASKESVSAWKMRPCMIQLPCSFALTQRIRPIADAAAEFASPQDAYFRSLTTIRRGEAVCGGNRFVQIRCEVC